MLHHGHKRTRPLTPPPRRLWLFALATVLLAGLGGGRLEACSCRLALTGSHPCLDFWHADAVFAGRPIAVETLDFQAGDWAYSELRFRFEVDEGFRGVEAGDVVEVSTGMGGGDCGYEFRLNVRYVVYASRDGEGGLRTGLCGSTGPADSSKEDLWYGRLAARGKQPTTLFGIAAHHERSSMERAGYPSPIASATIRAERVNDDAVEVVTDHEGRFELGLPGAGSYTVTADWRTVKDGATLPPAAEQQISVEEGRCVAVEIIADRLARITGTLVNDAGLIPNYVSVALIPAPKPGVESLEDNTDDWAVIDAHGGFTFKHVFPGEYLVVSEPVMTPRVFYPGRFDLADAQVVTVAAGETVDLGVFNLPKLEESQNPATEAPDGDAGEAQ